MSYYIDIKDVPFTLVCIIACAGLAYWGLAPASPSDTTNEYSVSLTGADIHPTVEKSSPKFIRADFPTEGSHDTRADFERRLRLDRFYLAATMWGEARNQGSVGMKAVGDVILNRIGTDPDRYGHTIVAAALRSKQFSCWNHNDPNFKKLTHRYLDNIDPDSVDGQRWDQAQEIAYNLLMGSPDSVGGAMHYHERSIKPFWAKASDRIGSIGAHIFYR